MIGDTKKPFRNYMEFSEYGTYTSATHATKVVLSPGSAIAELAFQSEVEILVIRLYGYCRACLILIKEV